MAREDQIALTTSPPQLVLYQMAVGHYLSLAVCLAAKLRIADLLRDGPRRFGDLARVTGTDAASLNRVMRLLASAGVFEEKKDGNFGLTALGQCLREDVPGSARALVMMFAGDWQHDAWKDLEYFVRTGEPTFRKRGSTISSRRWQAFRKRPPTSTLRWPISRASSRLRSQPPTISAPCGR
jgi:hypothetical protein